MIRTAKTTRLAALALTTALATAALSGCTTKAAPPANLSASKAQSALGEGEVSKAIAHAEAAVLAAPRDAQYRAMLGAAYLEAGRFQSAATSFQDAMSLGDNSPRTALSYALAQTAVGNYPKAVAVLDDWRDDLDPADLGLALALAGRPDEGANVLANALRAGQNTAKVRQNLAYAYALQGNWRAARLMVAEDVPADQVGARIAEWARAVQPEMYQARVAKLLGAPVVHDAGQPIGLALSNHPSSEQLAAEAAALAQPVAGEAPHALASSAPAGELEPVDPAPQLALAAPQVAAPTDVRTAFAAPAPAGATPAQITESMVAFISNPVVQKMPARYGAEAAPVRETRPASRIAATAETPAAAIEAADGKHLVQLGSFASREGARRAWGIYAREYPGLDRYRMVITEAQVRGKAYYRVSAGGLERADARSMCSTVKARGQGCFAWAEGRPLPGAVDTGVRMARR
ncbi:SPOR domain-containing protein [Altererythrobacter sp. C41]|uniref:SPOR domain-containing protein n=1 Tax=Altererythrobacter sp. C41 TaxID=2806021 RepID=UPI001932E40F|nr:SPOR domain-containing protein [Altererythrobacter sp. C41]MBM0169989.1 SPOR domain-containing protein [Altererythrobacter sp. C41]